MIAVTQRAKKELRKKLSVKADNPQAALRLTTPFPGQFGLSIDVEMPGDQVVEHKGSKVLLVEPGLAGHLEGHTLDIEDTADGPKLVILEGK